MVPLQIGSSGCWGPEVGGHVDGEGVGGAVVERGNYDGGVDVFGGVVEDFPAAWVEGKRSWLECWSREGSGRSDVVELVGGETGGSGREWELTVVFYARP